MPMTISKIGSVGEHPSEARGVRGHLAKPQGEVSLPRGKEARRDGFGLTRRELEVVSKLVGGCTTNRIAADLAMSGEAVKRHIASILGKLGSANRLEVVLFAVSHKLVDLSESDGDSPQPQPGPLRS